MGDETGGRLGCCRGYLSSASSTDAATRSLAAPAGVARPLVPSSALCVVRLLVHDRSRLREAILDRMAPCRPQCHDSNSQPFPAAAAAAAVSRRRRDDKDESSRISVNKSSEAMTQEQERACVRECNSNTEFCQQRAAMEEPLEAFHSSKQQRFSKKL